MEEIQSTPDHGTQKLSPLGRKFFNLIEFDEDEELLLEIRKHSIGLTFLFLIGGLIAAIILIITIALATSGIFDSIGINGGSPILVFVGFIMAILVMVVTFVNAELYRNNVAFITNEKIAQVLYISIFHRKVSQLNIGDAQDVTVVQETFFSRIFHYGTLIIETAGEQQNYTFSYVPYPHNASKIIINAHEVDLKKHGN